MSYAATTGGLPARRAIVRWARRLFRRNWRQHLLILVLLTVAVAAAIGLACAVYNIAPSSGQADFGDANFSFQFDDLEPHGLTAIIDDATAHFGAIDAIGHRPVAVPGTVKSVDYRVQQPHGHYDRPLLDLRSGRYPTADNEAAVTDWLAKTIGVSIGSTVDFDGVPRQVVGVVENPSDLNDEFVLLPSSAMTTSESLTMLVNTTWDEGTSYHPPVDSLMRVMARGNDSQDVVAVVLILVVTTLVMFLVALIAAASFAVIAQRRLPQLGMLAAVGASEKQVRLTMLASGAVTGVVAAVTGTAIGLGAWIAIAPAMESAVDYRIDPLNVPWWLVIAGMVLAIGTATAAAWWPARTMSRIAPMAALSGRPPKPAKLDRSALLALTCVAGGIVALEFGSNATAEVSTTQMLLIAVGVIAIVAGVLMFSPLAIRALAKLGTRAPISGRLALRDLGRYQARSGAALAAISLALGIPSAVVATAAAAENNIGLGNLSASQLMVRPEDLDGPFVVDPGKIDHLRAGVDALAKALPDATVIPLDAARDPKDTAKPGLPGLTGVSIGKPTKDGFFDVGLVFVATPELLAMYGLDESDIADADVITSDTGDLRIFASVTADAIDRNNLERVASPGSLPTSYSALPHALVSSARLQAHGWISVPSGRWLIDTKQPLTAAQLSNARQIATQYGLTVESRDDQQGLVNLRRGAVTIGMVLALAILAMTIGLIRSESSGDLRTLTASGATGSTRRNISAVTAGGLALLGAVLGIVGAYIGLAAGHLSDLTPVPLRDLLIIVVGTPLVAAAAGWVLAGREPAVLARRPIE